MKPLCMLFAIFFIAIASLSFTTFTPNKAELEEVNSIEFSPNEIKERLALIESAIDLKYNSVVDKHIRYYLKRRKSRTEKIIGLSDLYFPIFEHYLQSKGMPDEIKYLSIIESALNPKATSPVGAAGLWQFMKGTGTRYGLKIDSYVDERRDQIKSTEAATQFLSDLYRRYDDWTLALAAYNCGPGRVDRAIKRSRSKDYWKLRGYLPKETRNYVPAYIAAVYSMNFYLDYGLKPFEQGFKFDNLKTTKIYESASFYEMSKLSGIPTNVIELLNPAYKQRFIPKNKSGNFLTLPDEGMAKFKNNQREGARRIYYNERRLQVKGPSNSLRSAYTVQKGQRIDKIARLLRVNVHDLLEWNHMTSNSVFVGQELVVYLSRERVQMPATVITVPMEKEEPVEPRKRVLYHYVQQGETLNDIVKLYPGISVPDLMLGNEIQMSTESLEVGRKLKIREL